MKGKQMVDVREDIKRVVNQCMCSSVTDVYSLVNHLINSNVCRPVREAAWERAKEVKRETNG